MELGLGSGGFPKLSVFFLMLVGETCFGVSTAGESYCSRRAFVMGEVGKPGSYRRDTLGVVDRR